MISVTDSMDTAEATLTAARDLDRHRYQVFNCHVFSCQVDLAVVGEPARSFQDVEAWLRNLEHRFSRFVDSNELSTLNEGAGSWVDVSSQMIRLLTHALDVAVISGGLVNIAVTSALRDAGYTHSWPQRWAPSCVRARSVPALTEVLELRGRKARLQPGRHVDFGALAKGLWADDVVEMLGDNAAASIGGDVSAHGAGPDGAGWPVGLPNGRTALVTDAGVATSGVAKRKSTQSEQAHHIIDPRTGRPSDSGLCEVSVIAGCAATAEWMSTMLLVGGPATIKRVESHGGARCLYAASREGEESP